MKSGFGFVIALAFLLLGATVLSVVPVSAEPDGGLYGRYWQDSFFGVEPLIYPEWDWYDMPPPGPYPQPDMVRTDPTIDFGASVGWDWRPFEPGHQFSVKWTGYIIIPETGSYWFRLSSDDGSWLFIDGTLEIDNGGIHAPRTVDGAAILSEGLHEIVIDFYETANTQCGIVFSWKPPGAADYEVVSPDFLVPEPLPNPTGGVPEFSLPLSIIMMIGLVAYLSARSRLRR